MEARTLLESAKRLLLSISSQPQIQVNIQQLFQKQWDVLKLCHSWPTVDLTFKNWLFIETTISWTNHANQGTTLPACTSINTQHLPQQTKAREAVQRHLRVRCPPSFCFGSQSTKQFILKILFWPELHAKNSYFLSFLTFLCLQLNFEILKVLSKTLWAKH